ncbi:LOW QUALITY PROTEIN: hypothetical protein BC936DRAFT_142738 [Jimgerdemannia flammicorona]|uniref:non-specific serine/threonine protein kinase n=1 Tax=Jimgerdemannia flammicorona TaxID=994334 RepID=A0A433DET1_9FUNG|nr:LOW QUALITY PROTEIN: hypothetical protein BC936DRAFT_142738 [Jimgerdemannia flammicorona]
MDHVYHGDIKTENIQVTSWNWAYVTDFASFKPTYLPEDNPADFSFFFDTSSRRTCYLAPERFYMPGSDIAKRMSELEWGQKCGELTAAMDMFSVGCVIAELFLEGTPIFSLSQLFKYRIGDYDPGPELDKIEDDDIKALVKHMIQLDPTKRYTAEQYLAEWYVFVGFMHDILPCDFMARNIHFMHLKFDFFLSILLPQCRRGAAFPQYFYTFLHQYISSVTDPHNHYVTQPSSPQADLADALNSTGIGLPPSAGNASTSPAKKTDADENIERVYHDFDKIAFFLGFYGEEPGYGDGDGSESGERKALVDLPSTAASTLLLPPTLNIPNYDSAAPHKKRRSQKTDDGALIFLSLICAMVRNTAYPSPKLMALDMFLAIGEHLADVIKLDRLVPYLVTMLQDDVALVKASAVKTLTQLLCMVESISPINARIFPEYILPAVREFATDPEILVRGTYATCIALLAETALRFLEMTQLLKADGAFAGAEADFEELDYEATYDSSLHELQSIIQEQVTTLLIDQESSVKRALLTNITSLCIFFGRQKANDVLLSHMITYLNDRDWMLRCSFFESIIGVGTFVGGRSLEEYILPLMRQALTDSEEFVVEKALNSLTSLAELGLFQKMKLWELAGIIAPLLCHPSIWIRYGAVAFVASAGKLLPPTDTWCIIYPLIRPFLKADIAEITELSILTNVKSPLARQVFEQAIVWANKTSPKSIFWKQARDRKGSLTGGIVAPKNALTQSSSTSTTSSATMRYAGSTSEKAYKSDDDDQYLERLRGLGMTPEDEEKMKAMREYMYKLSRTKLNVRSKLNEDGVVVDAGNLTLLDMGISHRTEFLTPIYFDDTSNLNLDAVIIHNDGARKSGSIRGSRRASVSSTATTRTTDPVLLDAALNRVASEARLYPHMIHKTASTSQIDLGHSVEPISEPPHGRHAQDPTSSADLPFAIPTPIPRKKQSSAESTSPNLSPSESSNYSSSAPTLDQNGIPVKFVRQSKSRMQLMTSSTPVEQTKALAETSMSIMNAIGTMEISVLKNSTIQIQEDDVAQAKENADKRPEMQVGPVIGGGMGGGVEIRRDGGSVYFSTSYEGSARHLKNLINRRTLEAFPNLMPELGPKLTTMMRHRRAPVKSGAPQSRSLQAWKPEGILVAHLAEHKASVNQICLAPDQNFFASCSDDGTVKIWDCSRLERNVTNRSRATYNQQGGHIKAMTFIENTYSIASASDNGSIHVFRVDYIGTSSTPKYGKCQTVRKYQLIDEYAVAILHYNTGKSCPIVNVTIKRICIMLGLIFATHTHGDFSLCRTGGLECGDQIHPSFCYFPRQYLCTRSKVNASTVEIKKSEQSCVALVKHFSGATGMISESNFTTYIIYCVITSMVCDRRRAWLLVGTTRGILTLYDIRFQIALRSWVHPSKSRISRLLLHPSLGRGVIIAAGRNEVSVWNIGDKAECKEVFGVKDEKATGISLQTFKMSEPPADNDILRSTFTSHEVNLADNSVRAVICPPECNFMITGGSDRKIRFWDYKRVENSSVVLGLDIDEAKPKYSTQNFDELTFYYESQPSNRTAANNRRPQPYSSSSNSSRSVGMLTTNATSSTLVQQQQLLRNHLDSITDVKITEIPYPMLISGDRDGVIKVIA